jgi:putative DNA-invertase from lambdoid prophage Rac
MFTEGFVLGCECCEHCFLSFRKKKKENKRRKKRGKRDKSKKERNNVHIVHNVHIKDVERRSEMKMALYARTSTRDQHPENQLLVLREYAERMNYEFEVFEEQESTRKTRPVKVDLMQRLRRKEFDGILVLKLDRWCRSLSEGVSEVEELTKKGVKFISIRDNLDLETSGGRFYFHILNAFGQLERDIIRERTLDGLARAKAQGKVLGRPKGSRDKKRRKVSGYHLRWTKER